MRIRQKWTGLAALGVAALVISACSSSSSGGGAPTTSSTTGAPSTAEAPSTAASGPAASTAPTSTADGSGPVVDLKFESLAFQPPTVAAVKKIVADFNTSHPKIKVTLQQGTADTAGDQYTTQFQGGTAPDIIDFQSSLITNFIQQGFLADITQYVDPAVKSAIGQNIWDTVTTGGKIYAEPTLLQSYVVFANTDALKAAGVAVPTGATLTWDDFQAMAKKLTKSGQYGLGWGLKSPAATVLNLSLGFGGVFFTGDAANPNFAVGPKELQVPQRIKAMIAAKELDPTSVTQGGSDSLPAFFAGKYAMVVAGDYVAQTIKASAAPGFHWTVLPALAGDTSAHQGADPQTLSVATQSKNPKEAVDFINYFEQAKNLAAVGQGDWLIPASQAARDEIMSQTKGADGWSNILATAPQLVKAPFQTATGYPKWKTETMIPSLQKYFAGSLDDGGLTDALTKGWQAVGN